MEHYLLVRIDCQYQRFIPRKSVSRIVNCKVLLNMLFSKWSNISGSDWPSCYISGCSWGYLTVSWVVLSVRAVKGADVVPRRVPVVAPVINSCVYTQIERSLRSPLIWKDPKFIDKCKVYCLNREPTTHQLLTCGEGHHDHHVRPSRPHTQIINNVFYCFHYQSQDIFICV